jgi:hypothetical protein
MTTATNTSTATTPEERLDEANTATFVRHHRRILDLGWSARDPDSALPLLLEDLRANAQQYAQEVGPAKGPAPKRGTAP